MATKQPQPITGILQATTPLKNINKKLQYLQSLDTIVKAYLPEEIIPHIHVSNIGDSGRITITSDTSAWATQLRFHLPVLREQLHTKDNTIMDITVRVSPAWTSPS